MSATLLLALAGLALVDATSFGTLGIPVFLLLTTFAAATTTAATPAASPPPVPGGTPAPPSGETGGAAGAGSGVTGGASRGARGVGRLLVYLGTVAACYFALGVVLMTGVGALAAPPGEMLSGDAGRWVELVVGVALFAVSFRFDSKRAARKGESRLTRRLSGGPAAMVALGMTATAVEAATMLPYLGALGLMTAAGLSAAQWLPLLAGYVVIMIVPALLLIAVRMLAGRRVQALLGRLGAFMRKHSASAVGWLLGIAGFLLTRDAAAHLFF
ncbi:MAG: hypothetical protein GEV11_21310 [Streptosporangiales bacterium]|nr:hypothetical protein [Streptosporangiales bacterium]